MKHVIDLKGNGRTITVQRGDTVELDLEENPTTGYRWQVSNGLDELESDQYELLSATVGGGGMRKFTFLADSSYELRLTNCRTWSGEVTGEPFTLDVVVD